MLFCALILLPPGSSTAQHLTKGESKLCIVIWWGKSWKGPIKYHFVLVIIFFQSSLCHHLQIPVTLTPMNLTLFVEEFRHQKINAAKQLSGLRTIMIQPYLNPGKASC